MFHRLNYLLWFCDLDLLLLDYLLSWLDKFWLILNFNLLGYFRSRYGSDWLINDLNLLWLRSLWINSLGLNISPCEFLLFLEWVHAIWPIDNFFHSNFLLVLNRDFWLLLLYNSLCLLLNICLHNILLYVKPNVFDFLFHRLLLKLLLIFHLNLLVLL